MECGRYIKVQLRSVKAASWFSATDQDEDSTLGKKVLGITYILTAN